MSNQIAAVVANRQIAKDIWQMDLFLPADTMTGFMPGRFIQVKIPDAEHLILRRPFGINTFDTASGTFSIVYQVKGEGTKRLSLIQAGKTIEYVGPLGNGFLIPPLAKKVWIAGGGLGLAPLSAVVEKTRGVQFVGFAGFKSLEVAYQIDVFEQYCQHVFVATEDGSLGEKGLITSLLERELSLDQPDLILLCGPSAMAKAVKKIMEDYSDIPCQVSLEERMACGVGACRGCVCRIGAKDNWQYQRVCKEGPVFDLKEVLFDDEFAG
ncbi:MAG: dihydroorotate dehydrogenase electron transfer subunit [Christensenellales bacterium]